MSQGAVVKCKGNKENKNSPPDLMLVDASHPEPQSTEGEGKLRVVRVRTARKRESENSVFPD